MLSRTLSTLNRLRRIQKLSVCTNNIGRFKCEGYDSRVTTFSGIRGRELSSNQKDEIISVDDNDVKRYIELLVAEYYDHLNKSSDISGSRLAELKQIVDTVDSKKRLEESLKTLKELTTGASSDKELLAIAETEKQIYEQKLAEINSELLQLLAPREPGTDCSGALLEVSPGVGGQEAMLFARELFDAYLGYITFRSWQVDTVDLDESEVGGIRHAHLSVEGDGAWRLLRAEAGVHRVQRVPKTERAGRIHTSTVAVAVLPRPSQVEIVLRDSDLLIETKRASGAGGQHVNTTDSAVRVTHLPTGIVVESQEDRSQHRNRTLALERLRSRLFQLQVAEEYNRMQTQRKQQVGSGMRSEKIRTYNFQRDSVTDHRFGVTAYNLRELLQGGRAFNNFVCELQRKEASNRLLEAIHSKMTVTE